MNDADERPDENDLRLHDEITPKERLDTILTSRHMTTVQAVHAADALYKENEATYPHAVVVTVMARKSIESPSLIPLVSYIGPFRDRRAAELWATEKWVHNPRVSWEAVKMLYPQMYEAETQRMREILGEPET